MLSINITNDYNKNYKYVMDSKVEKYIEVIIIL